MTTTTTNTIEAAVKAVETKFNFTVDKFPLSGPDGMQTGWYGLWRSDNLKAPIGQGSVTSRYKPHQTADVVALVKAAGEVLDGNLKVTCHFDNGHYVSVMPSNAQRLAIYGTKDNIFPRFLVRAGYDGQAFTASMGMYRDACKNLSILKSCGQAIHQKIRHTESLTDRIEELVRQFRSLASSWSRVEQVATQMQSVQVDLAQFLGQVYPLAEDASQRSRTIANNRIESIFRRVIRERQLTERPELREDNGKWMVSGWEAYNAVQGYTQHDKSRNGKPDDFSRMLLALNDQAVAKAESLVMAMAS